MASGLYMKIAAGVKVSMLVSAVSDGPKRVALYGERTSEVKTLRIGPWVKDHILLIDPGFYKHQQPASRRMEVILSLA